MTESVTNYTINRRSDGVFVSAKASAMLSRFSANGSSSLLFEASYTSSQWLQPSQTTHLHHGDEHLPYHLMRLKSSAVQVADSKPPSSLYYPK